MSKKPPVILFFTAACMIAPFSGCENVVWNDLGVQGSWEKESKVMFVDKTMVMEIDNDGIRWKEKGADDWEVDVPCSASFGVIYIKFPDKTVKGSYLWALRYMILGGFTWDDRLNWLNGTWNK
ncbi:MAG: hypothetical protein LBD86_01415 [Spirochaetaceae bacterium]|jgi:hypothetical protein|nr:hypothetical protein [Spirochaetaceae bacterium]